MPQNRLVDLEDLHLHFVEEDNILTVLLAACVDSPNNELQISKKAFAELKERMKALKEGNKPILVAVNEQDCFRLCFMVSEQEVQDFVQDLMPD
jgi:thiamine monophosphate kinase